MFYFYKCVLVDVFSDESLVLKFTTLKLTINCFNLFCKFAFYYYIIKKCYQTKLYIFKYY